MSDPSPNDVLRQGFVPVPADQLRDHYARVVRDNDAELRRERRRTRGIALGFGALILANTAMAGAVLAMLPLKQVVPVYVTLRSDGTYNTTISQSDVPESLRDATMKATLWQYVASRERYSFAGHAEDQALVYILSDKQTGDEYQAAVAEANPTSPWRRYAQRAVIRVERVSETLRCARGICEGREPDTYQVRFRKVTRVAGNAPVERQYLATIMFRVAENVPAYQRVTANPMGLQVVSYTTTEEGAGQ